MQTNSTVEQQFKQGQKVLEIAPDPRWNERATIVRYVGEMTYYGTDQHYPGWYIVRYRGKAGACVHESWLQAA